jgi:beta-glucanase (GH16 family)
VVNPEWRLLWSDEFDGPPGTPVDARYWNHEVGAGGWGNGERQRYTDGALNTVLDGNGHLAIVARENASEYTSARITTQRTAGVRLRARRSARRLPRGRGIWSAFWMLGADLPEVAWPGCGEIDVFESLGHEPHSIFGTAHGPGYSGRNGISCSYRSESDLSDDFHVFGVEWQPEHIAWDVDGQRYGVLTPHALGGRPWVHAKSLKPRNLG